MRRYQVWILLLIVFATPSLDVGADTRTSSKKNVLILSEVGISHSLTKLVTTEIVSGVENGGERQVEFYNESLDLLAFADKINDQQIQDWLSRKYQGKQIDVIAAIGPDTIAFLNRFSSSIFPNVPIVICGSAADQAGNPSLGPQFAGTWQVREPEKTLELALHLFPETKEVFVVGGSSAFDHLIENSTRSAFESLKPDVKFTYLFDLEMGGLLRRLQILPPNSIIFFTSFFQDSAGNRFLNATKSLPMIAAAADAPVFGMSDTYLGNGVLGGLMMSFQEQGKTTARIISQLLDGKAPQELPIHTLSSIYMFDWRQLKRWDLQAPLPAGSVVFFREPSLWEKQKQIVLLTCLTIVTLASLVIYLFLSQKQLEAAKEKHRLLSGMLISAGEDERRRVASELHDDFSQRLAIMALRLEEVSEKVSLFSEEANHELCELLESTIELGTDLHTLSHHLHSSTLESLGLKPGIDALCREFGAKGFRVELSCNDFPRSLPPDTALCIFRVVQEALRNAKKYSKVAEASVSLGNEDDKLRLLVCDKGCGFDQAAVIGKGLGLRIMEERVRYLGGEFKLTSAPGLGTTISAWVPLVESFLPPR